MYKTEKLKNLIKELKDNGYKMAFYRLNNKLAIRIDTSYTGAKPSLECLACQEQIFRMTTKHRCVAKSVLQRKAIWITQN